MVKRRHVLMVDWSRAVAKAMSIRKDLNTQGALAKRSGVAQSTIGRILRGEVNPQSGNLELIARTFGLSLSQLAEMAQEGELATEPIDTVIRGERSSLVALISWVQAGSVGESLENPAIRDAEEWMARPLRSGVGTFALRVRGESMEPCIPTRRHRIRGS